MKPRILLLAAAAGCLYSSGPEDLYRIDLLPRLREAVKVGAVTSYDRTGGNDDGFSGKYSFVRREAGGLVLADLNGPGAIYRIWTPTPTDDVIEFYFDGESTPRIRSKFREIFSGEQAPFVAPLVGSGAGGFYSYVPLTFRRSCKVVAKAERIQFYQINYATYTENARIQSYSQSAEFMEELRRAGRLLGSAGADISTSAAPSGARLQTARTHVSLAPGRSAEIFNSSRAGRIAGIRLSPAGAFADKDRGVALRIYWDGDAAPAVNVPVGDFFGYAWGRPATKALLIGTSGETNYCYFPMPFDRSARIELVSEKTGGAPLEMQAEVIHAAIPRRSDEGRFYSIWRRENPTKIGEPFTFLNTSGRGHVAGVILQAQGPEPGATLFFEGDDQATIDGELAIHGTGSEDFFNGGWYNLPGRWDGPVSLPLSGCLDYKNELARTGGYRLMLADAYAYRKSITLAIEHSPTGNSFATDYTGVTFFYSLAPSPAERSLPPVAARRVTDPQKVVFTPGARMPVFAFSENAALSKSRKQIGGTKTRFLSLEPAAQPRGFVAFDFHVPDAGRYKVSMEALRGPGEGIVQLWRDEAPAGPTVDLYDVGEPRVEVFRLGTATLQEGSNILFFRVTGKNASSPAARLQIAKIVFEKVQD